MLDRLLPRLNGLSAARQIRRASPRTAVILLASGGDDDFVLDGFQDGVQGFVLKTQPAEDLLQAIREVSHGGKGARPAPMLRRLSRAAVLLALGLCGCGAEIGAPAAEGVPVIQALLVAQDSLQSAWVEWRVPADSAFGTQVRPVAPALVLLSLVLPDGSSVPFAPAAGVPGRFDAAVTVTPGSRYDLVGTVAGVAVSSATMVPGPLDIRIPAQDTVTVDSSCIVCDLPYQWFAAGGAQYLYMQAANGTTGDTIGVVRLIRPFAASDTVPLTVLALEAHAAAFLAVETPQSSIRGVFGLFGAASRAQRWIIFP